MSLNETNIEKDVTTQRAKWLLINTRHTSRGVDNQREVV